MSKKFYERIKILHSRDAFLDPFLLSLDGFLSILFFFETLIVILFMP